MTFWEFLNTVRFRDIAGRVRKEEDVPSLHALLIERQGEIQSRCNAVCELLRSHGYPQVAASVARDYVWIAEEIEKDIQRVEAYCRSRGITLD
jgi:hypothetical protein